MQATNTTEGDTMTATAAATWTIAYRKPRANRFRRVADVALTWGAAEKLAKAAQAENTGLDIWLVPTVTTEADAALVAPEDVANIMVPTGRRIAIVETGTLADLGVEVPVTLELRVGATVHHNGTPSVTYTVTAIDADQRNGVTIQSATGGYRFLPVTAFAPTGVWTVSA